MATIRTADMDFKYQVKEIFEKIHKNNKEEIKSSGKSFSDWMWENREELGKAFFEKVDEYSGVDEIISDMNLE